MQSYLAAGRRTVRETKKNSRLLLVSKLNLRGRKAQATWTIFGSAVIQGFQDSSDTGVRRGNLEFARKYGCYNGAGGPVQTERHIPFSIKVAA